MRQDDRTITRDGIKIHHSSDYEGMRKSCILAKIQDLRIPS